MNKSKGFTLIELVIVIVILGILGAVAAPRLFNLQGDAYGANLNAMKNNIATSMVMANAKAQLSGKGLTEAETTNVPEYGTIAFVAGFPTAVVSSKATPAGILATLDNFDYDRYKVEAVASSNPAAITITPISAVNAAGCQVTYTQARAATGNGTDTGAGNASAQAAKVDAVITGC